MQIKGHFERVIYYRQDNGYVVALFSVTPAVNDELTVVTGYMGPVDLNHSYILEGDYTEHPRYGVQFKFDSFEILLAANREELVRYLSSRQFKGIGAKYANTLIDALGMDLINSLRENPALLDEVPKMNEKRRQGILEGIRQETDQDNAYLMAHHLTMKTIIKLKNHYKDRLMSVLLDNPYLPVYEVSSIGFATMDKFALSIGVKEDDINRQAAMAEGLLMDGCMRNGDSYLPVEQFLHILNGKCSAEADELMDLLQQNSRIVIEEDRVYHISQYLAESYIAGYLHNFPLEPIADADPQQVNAIIDEVQQQLGIEYQEKQLEAIRGFFENDLMILTGGPGTGKTTIVRGMIELCRFLYPQYQVNLIAPTGRAAKRLSELTGSQAKTIHSLLLWDKESGKFARDEENPLTTDILIIDEFSMVDQYLFSSLLKACPMLKKLIIIGDYDQLPSVAMGAVLRDLIESELFTTIKLEKIYRQKQGSDIITLAYDIKNDICESICEDNDIRFFECDPSQIIPLTLQVVGHALENYPSLQSGYGNVQVLSPKHMGLNGINNLNIALQKQFNPPSRYKRELKVGYRTFRIDDKILQLKNQPDDDVFNGDIGIITDIIYASEDVNNTNRIICDFDGRMVEYTAENFANITHGYCISVHKAQGSEYPIVIIPMDNDYGIMLQKRLMYTAVSRAYQSLIFVGQKEAFFKAIATADHYQRKTTLKQRLWEYEH